jgi:L-rhamnose-H+ transport protein
MYVLLPILFVILAGCGTGTMAWPIKAARKYEFEHIWFVGMTFGVVVIPWIVTFISVPSVAAVYGQVPQATLIRSNIFAVCWGIANVLLGICFVRIGAALSGAIIGGIGASVGALMPFLIKGSGVFSQTPSLFSGAGISTLAGIALIMCGVALTARAGFARDAALERGQEPNKGFFGGLILISIAGVLSAGYSFAFVYSQEPIVQAMRSHGAGYIASNLAVWAAGLFAGALVNMIYPAFVMTRKKTWHILFSSPIDFVLSLLFGLQFITAVMLMGSGMVLLGSLGASIGFGIMQSVQILANQVVGFASGEWVGVNGRPRVLMYSAIGVLILATFVLAMGNFINASS